MSFTSKFKSVFTKLFKSSPTWVHTAQSVINFAAPIVLITTATFAPEAFVVVGPIIREIQTDLATASVLAGDGTATPSLTDALTRLQDNFGTLLAEGHVKDPKLQAELTLILGQLKLVSTMLPANTAKV